MENKDNLPSGTQLFPLHHPEPKIINGYKYSYWVDKKNNVYWIKEKIMTNTELVDIFNNDELWDNII